MKDNKDIQILSKDVQVIKAAILKSQHKVASEANRELLSLYYGIGRYVSEHTRKGVWGIGAIDLISQQLQKELPGLRGFSASAIKRMRTFYEGWEFLNRPLAVDDLKVNNEAIDTQNLVIRPQAVDELDWSVQTSLPWSIECLSSHFRQRSEEAL